MVPTKQSAYFANFMQRKSLDHLVELVTKENTKLKELFEKNEYLSKEPVIKKKGMKTILEEIRPNFYALTGIKKMRDPSVRVKETSLGRSIMQQAFHLTQHKWPFGALISMFAGMAPALFGAQLEACLASAAVSYSAFFGASYFAYMQCLPELTAATKAFTLGNKIFIPPLMKDDMAFTVAHEYTHYARQKTLTDTGDSFVEEGLASAIGIRMVEALAEKDASFRFYASFHSLIWLSSGAFAVARHLGIRMPNEQDMLTILQSSPKAFDYSGGMSMVMVAERIHGKETLYHELFKGNNGILLF